MCKIYDPEKNRPSFSPISRLGWKPLYPLYKDKHPTRTYQTWWYLYECEKCGVEAIFSTGGTPSVCKCQHKRLNKYRETKIQVQCDNCGKMYESTRYIAGNVSRHYCSKKCKEQYQINLKPTAEWQRLGNKTRNKHLLENSFLFADSFYTAKPSFIDPRI